MDPVHRRARPHLRRPKAVIAFEGWNDACEAASGAVLYLLGRSHITEPFATIEPEEFFDFQEHRPDVDIDGGGTRKITWPDTRFYAVPQTGADHDLILVVGDEPSFRWKTFARTLVAVLDENGVEDVVLLGAYIGQASHRQPVPLTGAGTDPDTITRHGLDTSSYEGPTGIVSVIVEACREAGIPALSIWAATPPYLAANANPATMLALIEKTADVLATPVDTTSLRKLARDFVQRVDEALEDEDEDLVEFISSLEQPTAEDQGDGDDLVNEIEEFLKEQG
jgi:predicted ATP-grasp superfamily ATP-dependent carboligase